MKTSTMRWGAVALFAATLLGCGGGGGGGSATGTNVGSAIASAAKNPANDTSINSSSAFKVLQDAGVPAVIVRGKPVVNFTVFSDGAVRTGLTVDNVRFAIAKLTPGTDGNPDQWSSYVYTTESTANPPNNVGSGPNGTPVMASAKQATTDARTPAQLVFNADGYYTYTFSTNITDPAQTNGVVFEPGKTHRIAIQLSYTNAAGETVRVNPYFDVTFDTNGNSVAVTDPNKTRMMAVVSSCNSCHENLALHGGGRVDVQYCVMCHNPGTTDANSGNVLTMATMIHKLHAGRLLYSQINAGGEQYVIWGYQGSKHDYSEVGFPQDLRNCAKCHTSANPQTPQGDNWKSKPSKEACLTCHANKPGSDFYASHQEYAIAAVGPGATPQDIPNSNCLGCHLQGSARGSDRVHWNQTEENAALYKMNIESVVFNDTPDKKGRSVTVKYYLSDPTNGNAAYNLVTPDCTGSGATLNCSDQTKFGNLRLYLAYQNMPGQPTAITEFTSYNNGGSGANVYAYKGANDGTNKYTANIPIPDDTPNMVAAGTARVISIGQIKEPQLQAMWPTDPRPPVVPTTLVNTVAQHTYKDVAISGTLIPRRQVVSNDSCNACHGALGTTSGSNTLDPAFHNGARNTVESCALCHDANRSSSGSTAMTDGQKLWESYQFKRMIHGIHGNSKRTSPFSHGNPVYGVFDKATATLKAPGVAAYDFKLTTGATVKAGDTVPAGQGFANWLTGRNLDTPPENYAAEVAYPDIGLNCNLCHVNNSWQQDRGTLGAVVSSRATGSSPWSWTVISPKTATCTSCHDSSKAIEHAKSYGGGSFATLTQGQVLGLLPETCDDCHAPGMGFKSVDIVHRQK